ncbi:MAG: adenosylcobinamide-GDP ribazoletransferase [Anaerovoracaceae bacterium]|jgi:cobalamin synthase/adenosyl cobinamide kinase/adenosyl cobinamide phosphate guanylyltransferase
MNVFISGGCKNGKSMHAQRLAKEMAEKVGKPLYYVATMIPRDEEDRARIRRHIADREGWGFQTLECGTEILSLLDRPEVDADGVFLFDSVTALLSNEMFREDGSVDRRAPERVRQDLAAFARRTGSTVFVSDYIYSDARTFDELTEVYRRGLAACDRELAKVCDQVLEVSFSMVRVWKGPELAEGSEAVSAAGAGEMPGRSAGLEEGADQTETAGVDADAAQKKPAGAKGRAGRGIFAGAKDKAARRKTAGAKDKAARRKTAGAKKKEGRSADPASAAEERSEGAEHHVLRDLVTAFFMAWGNFITLPCPYKRWDNRLKNGMLMLLPSVGLVVGVLWMLLADVLSLLPIPSALIVIALIFYIFKISGYMHLDGFMDCCDAILSRRPLEERQRIMKDSTVGSFAVVSLGLLLLVWYGALSASADALKSPVFALALLYIPIVSRTVSGLCVLGYRPIGHSQYVESYKEKNRGKYRLGALLQVAVYLLLGILVMIGPLGFGPAPVLRAALIPAAVTAAAAYFACLYARHQLGGMSGDIAGYTISLSELAGALTMAVLAGLFGIA